MTGAAIGPTHPVILALKAERERRGWSQKEVCRRAFIASGQLSRIEAGTVSPTLTTLSAWARALGMKITLEDLT